MKFLREPLLYQNAYVWFVLVSSLDVMLTWVVLAYGGREANGLARFALRRFGLVGLVGFKFVLVVFIICLCEVIGRRSPVGGKRLAEWSVALTCVPLVIALLEIRVQLASVF